MTIPGSASVVRANGPLWAFPGPRNFGTLIAAYRSVSTVPPMRKDFVKRPNVAAAVEVWWIPARRSERIGGYSEPKSSTRKQCPSRCKGRS